MKRICNSNFKGMTVIEIIVSMLLLSFAFITIGKLTASRITEAENLNYHYEMQSADSMMYGMYKDFHNCSEMEIVKNIEDGSVQLIFKFGLEKVNVYEYIPESNSMWLNGVEQFHCVSFLASGDMNRLYVSLKLNNGQRLDYEIFN